MTHVIVLPGSFMPMIELSMCSFMTNFWMTSAQTLHCIKVSIKFPKRSPPSKPRSSTKAAYKSRAEQYH